MGSSINHCCYLTSSNDCKMCTDYGGSGCTTSSSSGESASTSVTGGTSCTLTPKAWDTYGNFYLNKETGVTSTYTWTDFFTNSDSACTVNSC